MSSTETIELCNVGTIRWGVVDRLANGDSYVVAWYDPNDPHNSTLATVTAGTDFSESQVYDLLRIEILKALRKQTNKGIQNNRGDRILVGGGYR